MLSACQQTVGGPKEHFERLRGWHCRLLHFLSLLLVAWCIVCLVRISLRPPCSASVDFEQQRQELDEACSFLTFAFVAPMVNSGPLLLAGLFAHRALCLRRLLAEKQQDRAALAAVSELVREGAGISQKALAQWCPSHTFGSNNPSMPSETPSTLTISAGRFENCTICLEDVVGGQDRVRDLPCRHVFHVECIDRWLRTSQKCPMCCHANLLQAAAAARSSGQAGSDIAPSREQEFLEPQDLRVLR
ncbi:unnamed protein product [Polarella glacialis]|uniref:RING-type domain-containing protein n=1 Tax=Polarella glacialis TaxID=89957 RepID=A0A813DZK0_POLGL|nr:unnamed protein product [Polarella glacialis]